MLADAGYRNLTRSQAEECIKDLYQTLELRVGRRLSRKATSLQLSQFEKIMDKGDDEGAAGANWLRANIPDYQEVVAEELNLILDRLKSASSARDSERSSAASRREIE
jgi:hypothetical protein